MNHLFERISLELQKQYWETKRSWIGGLISMAIMAGLFVLVRNTDSFQFLIRADDAGATWWIYCVWIFCMSASLDVSKSVCADITRGTLAYFAQSFSRLNEMILARFVSSCTFTALYVALIALSLLALPEPLSAPSLKSLAIAPLMLLQTYALTVAMVAAALSQKSEVGANLVGLVISVPAIIFPADRLLGYFAPALPVAGPITMIRTDWQFRDLILASVATIVWLILCQVIFRQVVHRLRRLGSLLFK
jgi:hypothetical protein